MLSRHTFHAQPISHFRKFFFFGVLAALLLVLYFWLFGGSKIIFGHKDLLAVPWPSELDFAGEPVPLSDFYVRENWEREFLLTLSQDYQNLLYLKRAPKFFPLIETELKARGMPEDLKYLAVAESGLREDTVSSASAVGVWQFIPSTARNFGLRVDDFVDERRDTAKATRAALDYLGKLKAEFGSYTLAAAAYNVGENGLARELTEQGVPSYYDLYLNSETSRYLFRILAIKYVMRDPVSYGYDLGESDYFVWPKTVTVTAGAIADLAGWAKTNGTNLRSVKELNPWIVGEKLPAGSWQIEVPVKN